MVSPLASLVANLKQAPSGFENMGERIQGFRLGEEQINLAQQQQQMNEQQMQAEAQRQQAVDQGQSAAAEDREFAQHERKLQFMNRLGRRLLSADESQWPAIVQPHLPALTAMGFDPSQLGELTREKVGGVVAQTDAAIGDMQRQATVRSTQNLPGGLTKNVMSDGSIVFTDAGGNELSGEDAVRAVEESRSLDVSTQEDKSAARERGKLGEQVDVKARIEEQVTRAKEGAKNATGKIKEFYNQLGNIHKNIGNYAEAISLIDQGASTGRIMSKLPSVRAASQKLDNVKGRLGLDVVGNTTFGALSEKELSFATDIGLPTNLKGPELKKWLQEKSSAQQKLADYIDNAIQFLSIEGNTLADLQATAPRQNVGSPEPSQDFSSMSDDEFLSLLGP